MMDLDLDRIEQKLRKLRSGCEFLVCEFNENHDTYLFQEAYELVTRQIDPNLQDIDQLRIDYAHGVNISSPLKTLKGDFNYTLRFFRHLYHLYNESTNRPRRVRRLPLRPKPY